MRWQVARVMGLEDAAAAQTLLEERRVEGRVVLKISDEDW
jgi:hypothetical protein